MQVAAMTATKRAVLWLLSSMLLMRSMQSALLCNPSLYVLSYHFRSDGLEGRNGREARWSGLTTMELDRAKERAWKDGMAKECGKGRG
jgi:hypothetical protein